MYTSVLVYLEVSSFLPTHVPSQTHIKFLQMDSNILGLVTRTAWTLSPGAIPVRSCCRAVFKFINLEAGKGDEECKEWRVMKSKGVECDKM